MAKTKNYKAWLRRFYPVPAETMRDKSWLACVRHSIRKWRGLDERTLQAYGMFKREYSCGLANIDDRAWKFYVDNDSCALCVRTQQVECDACPIVLMRGDACDDNACDDIITNGICEYAKFNDYGNTQPMLKLLRKVERWLKTKKGKAACR